MHRNAPHLILPKMLLHFNHNIYWNSCIGCFVFVLINPYPKVLLDFLNRCGSSIIESFTYDSNRVVYSREFNILEFDVHNWPDNLDDLPDLFFFFFFCFRFCFRLFFRFIFCFFGSFQFYFCHASLQILYFPAKASTAVIISRSSSVIEACRILFKTNVRSLIKSSAFLVALSIAIIRAACSETCDSK